MSNKEIYIILGIIVAVFFLGSVLWDTSAHDFGVILQTLAGIAFLWWCFGIKKKE